MSEYQYYEFLAIDQPLSEADRQALRAISTRARITATQFVNSYEWGDFKGDPVKLMDRWFDLHLYSANWGTRRLMLRLPKRFVDLQDLGRFLDEVDEVTVHSAGDNIVFDILSETEDFIDDEWSDDSGRLSVLAPLRSDVIVGDLRFFYLLWLMAVETGSFEDDTPEPLPGIGPLTASLQAFADFLCIDPDLVRAAAENETSNVVGSSDRSVAQAVADLSEKDKNTLLVRLYNADPYVGADLKLLLRNRPGHDQRKSRLPVRTVGDLCARAGALSRERSPRES